MGMKPDRGIDEGVFPEKATDVREVCISTPGFSTREIPFWGRLSRRALRSMSKRGLS